MALSFGNSAVNMVRAEETDDAYSLPVFETSDVHGYIAEQSEDEDQYLLAYIADKVKDVRGYGEAYDKDAALLLDGGDTYQGSSLSNLLEGNSIAAVYAQMEYDAVTIRNQEFDWGITTVIDSDGTMKDSQLEGYERENTVPVVSSNLYLNDQEIEWMRDYVIVTKTARNAAGEAIPVRIGVIGYADDYSSEIMTGKFKDLGFSIRKDPAIPNSIARELEEGGQADATVLLCHADAKETAESLGADSVIDLVSGGHTHDNENGITEDGMPYLEPAKYGNAYCYAELVFDLDGDKAVFRTVADAKNMSVKKNLDKTLKTEENAEELDPDLVSITDAAIEKLQVILNTRIGYITTSAKKKGFIDGSGKMSTTGGNWMSSVYQRAVSSEVAFTNYGGVRYDFNMPDNAAQRDVTLSEIHEDYPFENHIFKYSLTYEELLEVFNYALKDEERKAISSVVGIDCYYENDEVNALVKDGKLIYQDGDWKDGFKDRTVTVATNEYVGTSDDVFKDTHNPLVRFTESDRLIEQDQIDVDCAVDVLTREAAENNGLLTIDTMPHFIEGRYHDPDLHTPNT
ncbi:MAG: 5'-nucleotidase C-terminal domain-containing protein, partial [Solobacterium sp.]|nr:5'-nucleotidase C-terminal domain-containing protein [Solobacterium sp.]